MRNVNNFPIICATIVSLYAIFRCSSCVEYTYEYEYKAKEVRYNILKIQTLHKDN